MGELLLGTGTRAQPYMTSGEISERLYELYGLVEQLAEQQVALVARVEKMAEQQVALAEQIGQLIPVIKNLIPLIASR